MSTNPISFRFPFETQIAKLSPEVQQVHRTTWNAITDLQGAIPQLKAQIDANKTAVATATKTTNTNTSSQTVIPIGSTIGTVSNQTSLTAYITQQSDYGAFILLDDASPIAITLSVLSSSPGIQLPWYAIFLNLGAGTATLTPASGTISYPNNLGAGSMPLTAGNIASVVFDGTNFYGYTVPVPPADTPLVAHKFFKAYNASTGAFTVDFIAESDLPASSQVGVFGATIGASDVNKPQFITVPYNCTITDWTIMADASGSASVDVWFIAGSAPPTAPNIPTSGNKISASAPIATSTAQSAAGGATAISTWTTALTIWGTLAFNLSSITTSTKVTIQIQVQRS